MRPLKEHCVAYLPSWHEFVDATCRKGSDWGGEASRWRDWMLDGGDDRASSGLQGSSGRSQVRTLRLSGGTGLADAALPSSPAVPRLRSSSRVFVVSLLIPSTRRLLRPGLYMMCFCIDELSRAGLFLLTALVTPNVCGFPVNTRLPNSLAVTSLPFRSVRFLHRPRGVPRSLRLSPAGLPPLPMPAASEVMG